MFVKINGEDYQVNNNEFEQQHHDRFTNLLIRKDVGYLERIVSLICELNCLNLKNLIIYNTNKGGYLPINCSFFYENLILVETQTTHIDNILINIDKKKINNINVFKYLYNIENIDNSSVFIFISSSA